MSKPTPKMIEWAKIKAEFSGPGLISVRTFLAFCPFVLISSMLAKSNLIDDLGFISILAVDVFSLLLTLGYYWGFGQLAFKARSNRPIPAALAAAFGFSVGSFKAISTAFAIAFLQSEPVPWLSVLFVCITVSLFTLVAVLGMASLAAKRDEFQLERDKLVLARVERALLQKQQVVPKSEILAISAEIERMRDLVLSGEVETANHKLQNFSTDSVRPASHSLWRAETNKFTNYSTVDLLRYALINFPFNPLRVATATAIGATLISLTIELSEVSLYRGAINFATVFLVYALAQFIKPTRLFWISVYYTVVVICTALLVTLATNWLLGETLFPDLLITFGLNLTWIGTYTLMIAGLRALVENNDRVQNELAALTDSPNLEKSVAESLTRIDAMEIGNHLHSTVQNRLLATGLRIKQSKLSGSQMLRELDQIEKLLQQKPEPLSQVSSLGLSEQLFALSNRWAGFIDFEFGVSGITRNRVDRRHIQVIEEAVSNAVRHGHATTVSVSVQIDETSTKILVLDNGFGPRSGTSGKGQDLFNSVSKGNWSLQPIPEGGSKLELVISN